MQRWRTFCSQPARHARPRLTGMHGSAAYFAIVRRTMRFDQLHRHRQDHQSAAKAHGGAAAGWPQLPVLQQRQQQTLRNVPRCGGG